MRQYFNKIGIFGGTFNPIHIGHLIIAESVRESFGLEKVLLMPLGRPPHKPGHELADPESRYEMVRLAARANPFFEASRLEIDMEGYTYTVNTLQALKKIYGEAAQLYFIIGADVVLELDSWKDFRTVAGLCEFIAVHRPGSVKEDVTAAINRLKTEYGARISVAEAPLIDISSSGIRKKCAEGKSIRYLVTDGVGEYIRAKELYGIAGGGMKIMRGGADAAGGNCNDEY